MFLSKISIRNYRSIKSQDIEFSPAFRLLIGKNEVGKTNVLSACSLIDPDAAVQPSDLRESRDDEEPVKDGSVIFVFRVSSAEMQKFGQEISRKILAPPNCSLCTYRGVEYSHEAAITLYEEWLHLVKIPSGERVNTHWAREGLVMAPGWFAPKRTADIAVDPKDPARKLSQFMLVHKSVLSEEQLTHCDPLTPELFNSKYSAVLDHIVSPKIPKCLFWRYSDENLLPSAIDIESFKADPASCEPLRSMFLLAREPDPAAALIAAQARPNGLKNLLTRVARAATADLQKRWKELKSVQIVLTPNGQSIDAAVKDTYNEYSFNRRSDGFKRFVSFLLLVSARSSKSDFRNVVFIQDEPDLGLHPTGVRSLLAELIGLSEHNYVLVSTHSIFMVDKERIERHYIVAKEGEETRVSVADRSAVTDEEVLLNALGYSLYDQIKPINLVFEGWRDKRLFMAFLRRRNDTAGKFSEMIRSNLGAVHAMGVKDIPKVLMYFEAVDRHCVVITDGDDVARDKQRELRRDKPGLQWYRYDELLGEDRKLTAEDFLSPALLKSSLKVVLDRRGIGFDIPDATFSPEAGGVVAAVAALLPGNKGAVKEICNEWKSQIFESLDVGDISAEYEAVAASLLERLEPR